MERHDTLLVACSSQENRELLRGNLQGRFNLLEASNSSQMLLLLGQNLDCIAAVLMDNSQEGMLDKEQLTDPKSVELLKKVPVIVLTSDQDQQQLGMYFRFGASDVIPLGYDGYAMLRRIENLTQLHLSRQHLQSVVEEQSEILRSSSRRMIEALASMLEYSGGESGSHLRRIQGYTRLLMEEVRRHCPEYRLTPRLVEIITSAAALHDVGRMALAGQELPQEQHPLLGCGILSKLDPILDREHMIYAYNICRYHHERWDGGGYPEGLQGEYIPICAQVVGLADTYEEYTSRTGDHARAVNRILKGELGAFSPKLLDCFKHVAGAMESLGRDPEKAAGQAQQRDMTLPEPDRAMGQENSLDRLRSKYFALVHYINAFLVEIELDRGLFHVVYNPYPELARLQNVDTVGQLRDLVLEQIVVPQERAQMEQLLRREIPRFVDEDMRRATYRFHYQQGQDAGEFEMSLLRLGDRSKRRSLAVLCRKLPQGGGQGQPMFPELGFVCRNDGAFTLVHAPADAQALAGFSIHQVHQELKGSLMELIHPQDREPVRRETLRQLQNGALVKLEHRLLTKEGKTLWVANKSMLAVGPDGNEYLHVYLSDITAAKTESSELGKTLDRYLLVLGQTENALFDFDPITGYLDVSDTWESVFGYPPPRGNLYELLATGGHIHPDDVALFADGISRLERGSNYEMTESRIATAQGVYRWCRFRATAIRDEAGKLIRVAGIIINIDGEKAAQQELQDKAERDALTGLLNKEAGRRQAQEYLSRFRGTVNCALLIIDLDNFKLVNDRYGHLFGDAVLTRVSREIRNQFHAQDLACRIGGDEFMVFLRGVSDRELLERHCRRLRDVLAEAFSQIQGEVRLGCSIGIALCPQHGQDYFQLYGRADQALYRAKELGKNGFCFYDESMEGMVHQTAARATPIDSDQETGMGLTDITHQVFRTLNRAKDLSKAVDQVIALMGRRTNVSRVYVFQNSPDNKTCSNTYEWCNTGIQPEIHLLQNVSYETDIPNFEQYFNEEGIFYCPDVKELPRQVYEILEPQGIQSMLLCAIRENGVFRGYIGFDECSRQRLWTKEEIDVLSYCSEILSLFLLKN